MSIFNIKKFLASTKDSHSNPEIGSWERRDVMSLMNSVQRTIVQWGYNTRYPLKEGHVYFLILARNIFLFHLFYLDAVQKQKIPSHTAQANLHPNFAPLK